MIIMKSQPNKSENSENLEKESRLKKILNDPLFRELSSFTFELLVYYPTAMQVAFLKLTKLGKCKQNYCTGGDYCNLSKSFLAHKWFAEYFCKIPNHGPDEERIRERGIFHSYLGCSSKKKQS